MESTSNAHQSRAAFTVLEVLTVLVVVAALMSITLPALSGVRGVAQASVSMSNMRQHSAVFNLYHTDFNDFYPYFTHPDRLAFLMAGRTRVGVHYFEAYATWNIALANMYYDGEFDHDTFAPPSYREEVLGGTGRIFVTTYLWSSVFLADPAYWTYDGRIGPEQYRATRADEVVFPSSKALLWADWPSYVEGANAGPDTAPSVAFVDGSVRMVRIDRLLPGHREGTGVVAGGSMMSDYPTMHTINGVRGRDFQ